MSDKFCKDCRWCSPHMTRTWFGLGRLVEDYRNANCFNPKVARIRTTNYLVTGKLQPTYPCDNERTGWEHSPCGPTAKLFEARK